MIPLQPWLVPLLVMTVIAGLVAIWSAIGWLRQKPRPSLRRIRYVRVAVLASLTTSLAVVSLLILIYGEEAVEKIVAFLTFIPVAVGFVLTVDALLRPLEDGVEGYASRVRDVLARKALEPGSGSDKK